MKGLLKKFRENKKGFTLAELLVVVAIVAILVAISVPIFTAQLGKARKATNEANLRAAKVAAVADYMTNDDLNNGKSRIYLYDMKEGTVSAETLPEGIDTVEVGGTGTKAVSTSKVYAKIYVEVVPKVVNGGTTESDVEITLYAK